MRSVIIDKALVVVTFVRALFTSTGRRGSSTKRRFLGVVSFALVGFSTWAGLSEFDQVISGEAKVVPSQQLQTIQHFEGGIVKEIHVRSGMDVTLGQALISLDPLESGAEYQAKRSEFIQALIRVRRLSAEHRGVEPTFDTELQDVAASQIDNELLLAKARKARLDASLASFDSQIRQKQSELEGAAKTLALVKEERKVILTLVKKGLEPGLEAVRAEKTYAETVARVNEIRAAIDEVKDRRSVTIQEYSAEILDELAQASLELSKLEQAVNVAADKSDRSVIRSPVAGTVNRVFTTTVGGMSTLSALTLLRSKTGRLITLSNLYLRDK
jgi:adhesin transport system membrane fusion protein